MFNTLWKTVNFRDLFGSAKISDAALPPSFNAQFDNASWNTYWKGPNWWEWGGGDEHRKKSFNFMYFNLSMLITFLEVFF